ncbi:MAG TPA: copper resistance protein NlpE [Candidatus Saccharimonadales bacterium]|nr:copper resistance protein NlpE [Candidatus Saccharimonadales bacterium]
MVKKNKRKQPLLFIEILIIALIIFCIMAFIKILHTSPQQITQTYTGVFPCADCSGLDTTLTLTMNNQQARQGTYTLQEIYKGKDLKPFITSGTWNLSKGSPDNPNALIIVLQTAKTKEMSYFQILNPETLGMLDQEKKEITSPFNLELFLRK